MTEAIEHTAHPDQLLVRAAQLVRPDGYVIMTTPNVTYIRNKLPKFSESSDPAVYQSVQFNPTPMATFFCSTPTRSNPSPPTPGSSWKN
ncbi:MAG: hypothetical protein ABIU29_08540 [Chthoniobacterales bacterium]